MAGVFGWLWRRERRVLAVVQAAYRDAERGRQVLLDGIEALPSNLAVFAPDGELVASNESYRGLHAHVFASRPGRVYYEEIMLAAAKLMLPADEVEADVAARVRRHFGEAQSSFERLYPNGRWMLAHKKRLASGHVAGLALDITDIKAREGALATSEARYRALIGTASVAIWQVDEAGRTLFANPRLGSIFGRVPADVAQSGLHVGTNTPECPFGFPPEREVETLVERSGGLLGHVLLAVSPWLADRGGSTCVLTMIDITPMKEAQSRLEHLAGHDSLTGLSNRGRFTAALEDAVASADGGTLLLIDLDQFKAANDMHGHAAGDAILGIAARRMTAVLRAEDAAFRLGGDEFAVLLSGCDRALAAGVAARLVQTLGQPYVVDGESLTLSASVGIARAPFDAVTAKALSRAADSALYTVKRSGRANYTFFDEQSVGAFASAQ